MNTTAVVLIVVGVLLVLPSAFPVAIWWWEWTAESVADIRNAWKDRAAQVHESTWWWAVTHVVTALVVGMILVGVGVQSLTG